MAKLPMPDLEKGPLRDLIVELHRLHARAGWPGVRTIAEGTDSKFAPMTVHAVFTKGTLPSSPQVLQIGRFLIGRDVRKPDQNELLDHLDHLWTAAERRSDSAVMQPPSTYQSEPFTLGSIKSTLLIVEGDGGHPIARRDVRLVIDSKTVEVPDEVAEWREAIIQEQARIEASGREPMWNGSSYAVDYVSVSRVPDVEDSRISIGLQRSDYFTFLAAQQLDRPMRDGQTLRSRYLDGKHWSSVPPFISSSFGINVAVSTADDQIIFSKRSSQVGTQPNVWNSSANEGLSRELDSTGTQPPDLFRVAERGLDEELGISPGDCELQLLGITLDVKRHQWGCIFWGRLQEHTADDWFMRTSRGVRDRFEHDSHELVPFTPEAVIQKLLEINDEDAWAPVVPALYYLTLVRRFGRATVERVAAQLL
ncbi:hypothetical protein GCM10010172_31500 [Paractinoplanes ferrugineus]|uniref:Nudix hydrolase domain-containing protein n=1 Tax=Paractinoplanes ferrugineus TaxID=113564 RepID=A0A919J6Y9_9ACTN|nr:hypothetical protein [Actinoplanes ferrugineus]GIE14158.1 hypothetical protein Afe05nite_59980 [Actinoplanes ferrugineus]